MNEQNSNFLRDFLIIILSSIIAVTCIVVANNYGLIKLYSANKSITTVVKEEVANETTSQLSVSEVAEKAIACSVSVYITDSTKSYYNSAGSGVILKYDASSGNAFVITNDHVIASSVEGGINIYYFNSYYVASLIGTDPENDIAVLSFKPGFVPSVAEIGRSLTDLKVGERVVAVGNAAALDYTVTDGLISYIGRKQDYSGIEKYYVQTSAVINSGNSGGGLFDMEGKLIAINTMGLSSYDDLNFSLPILFNSAVSLCNVNYSASQRDAITSFNCLIAKHNELVTASAGNVVGYIESQNYIGAKFETLTMAESGTVKQYAYVSGVYSYFNLETGSYEWSGLRYASSLDTTNIALDVISKVEYSVDNGSTWQTAVVEGSSLLSFVELNDSFSSVDVMNFVRKATVNTLIRFTVQTKLYNQVSRSLSNYGAAKTTIAKVTQYQFEYAS